MNSKVTEEMVKEKIQLKNCELLGICVCLVHFYLPETAGSSVSIETRNLHVLETEAFSSPSEGAELHPKNIKLKNL